MKTSRSKMRKSAICLLGVALAMSPATVTVAEEFKVRDIELDFHFLRLGLTRKTVVGMLGEPGAEAVSQTLAIKYHKLIWTGPDGQRFVAAFVQNRLWRWKRCSTGVADC
jgi:hypothetical protein